MPELPGSAEVLAKKKVRNLLKDSKRGLRNSFRRVFQFALYKAAQKSSLGKHCDYFVDSFWVSGTASAKPLQFKVSYIFLPRAALLIVTEVDHFEKALKNFSAEELERLQEKGFS